MLSHIDSGSSLPPKDEEETSQDDQESERNDESQSPPLSLQPTQTKKRSLTCLDSYMDREAAFPGAGSGLLSKRGTSRFVGRSTSSR